ncbi:MAG TPA: neuraminidase-like domain-containing protein [Candidatus Kapabacteria bacterium]|nr:neuraminidase-like domain-containing protein [Candidatus Kapabacteria bacterium]
MDAQEQDIQPKAPPPQSPQGCGTVNVDTYTVNGTVSSSDRVGAGGLQVQIVDKGVGADFPLVTATTDDCGNYSATFPSTLISSRGKKRPDLQAKALVNGLAIATSDVQYNAGATTTLNITIPERTRSLPAEHDTLTQALAKYYTGPLGALREDDGQKDISYLANKTGWDARAVAMAALADHFSTTYRPPDGTANIPALFYYALFRGGVDPNPATLFHTDEDTLTAVWSEAAHQGVIGDEQLGQVQDVLRRVRLLSAQRLVSDSAVVGASSFSQMLTVSGLSSDQQNTFARAYSENKSDPDAFWDQIQSSFGPQTTDRLKLDGKLAFLTLHNASLMTAIRNTMGGAEFTDPSQLVQKGYYAADAWQGLLADQSIPVPPNIPGDDDQQQRANYAEFLAAQVAASYPTEIILERVQNDNLPVSNPGGVANFLTQQSDSFDIGTHPIEQYLVDNQLSLDSATLEDIKSVQRVYQITRSDSAMTGLLGNGLNSATAIARYDKDSFVNAFGDSVGGADAAGAIHERATQIHNVTLNLALSYLTAKNGLPIGAPPLDPDADPDASRQILQPAPQGPVDLSQPHGMRTMAKPAAFGGDILAYQTLETLFGSMDYCSCDECRSILSPAAYLVDLLHFVNQPAPPAGTTNPQTVLFQRRPDLQYLPLTCENTNTALPYIDLVNETLEYFIANGVTPLSLSGYIGHDTGTASSEDLLASPAYVMSTAYSTLSTSYFPPPLPFHQPLENHRRYYKKCGAPLQLVMERLRPNENLDRGSAVFGWRDILMEELGISRQEYDIFTNSTTIPLWKAYGWASSTADATVIATLSNAKDFCRRMNISYDDLVEILETRFVNPNSDLIPKLQRLGLNFSQLQQVSVGALSGGAFVALLPVGPNAPNPADYGQTTLAGITTWIIANYSRIRAITTLVDITGVADTCNFSTLELRFSYPMSGPSDTSTRLGAAEYYRLVRFIRLWRRLGWSIEDTDAAICGLFTLHLANMTATDVSTPANLDAGFLRLLPRLGIVVRIIKALNLTVENDLRSLLACWADIDTYGPTSQYARMFLNATILNQDAAYADNGVGLYLQDPTKMVYDHAESLRAAFNLTSTEFTQIFNALGYTTSTVLNVANISAIYRRGYMARILGISVSELLLWVTLTGIDPFVEPSLTAPATLDLIHLLADFKARGLSSAAALYLVWNQDLSGTSAPTTAAINDVIRSLRSDYAKINVDFAIVNDPTGEIARSRMTLVYGTGAADFFFGLLNDTFASDTYYSHVMSSFGPVLASAIQGIVGTYGTASASRVSYDDFHKRISFTGRMTTLMQSQLVALATNGSVVAEINSLAPGTLATFQTNFPLAINALYAANSSAIDPFFTRYPELLPLFTTYLTTVATPEVKRTNLLAGFLPTLIAGRKTQQTLQRMADAAQVDRTFAATVLNPTTVANGLHAANPANPALTDLLAVETQGLAAQYYDAITVGPFPHALRIDSNLSYAAATSNTLPANVTSPGSAISGVWTGSIEPAEDNFYNFIITAENTSTVTLVIDGVNVPLSVTSAVWTNTTPVQLKAGTLSTISVTILNVKNTVSIQWSTSGYGRVTIPAKALYASTLYNAARDAYLRFLKAGALANTLKLNAGEVARPVLSGNSWLNSIPVIGTLGSPATMVPALRDVINYAVVKAAIAPGSDSLLTVVNSPTTSTATSTSLLFTLTGWDFASFNALVTQFVGGVSNISQPFLLRRVMDAMTVVKALGISAGTLITNTTNDPTSTMARDLQAALRAQFAMEDWRQIIQPINDQMRSLQRDALVAYILHQMHLSPSTQHIDTPDKLFEYFLMDVQMEPCMQTSRIRHALSGVQLFIERCMMNLEPRCSPDSLNATHWEWMKRYRVWEANRKVFLYPENWLEPELRDDKSPFFKEMESELLQSDITEETASVALLNYLAKLEEVAKLEPCGFYHVEANASLGTGDVDHVIARTAGAHRKYYYRRREYGYWTPWELVKLDIEDNPISPVIWNDRLLLFWTRIVRKGPDSTGAKPTGTHLGDDLSGLNLPPDPNSKPYVVLYWSEYYNGKWQAPKTTDVENPIQLGTYPVGGSGTFDRSQLWIDSRPDGTRLRVSVYGVGYATFLFFNLHAQPLCDNGTFAIGTGVPFRERMFSGDLATTFGFGYIQNTGWMSMIMSRTVLKPDFPYRIVEAHQPFNDWWNAPLFYYDNQHVFYVSSRWDIPAVRTWSTYGIPISGSTAFAAPGTLVFTGTAAPASLTTWASGGSLAGGTITLSGSVTGARAMGELVATSGTIHTGIGSTALVPYSGGLIGPTGLTGV